MKIANMLTRDISRRGEQLMPASAVVQNHEERISFLPTERLIAEGTWTQSQQRLLEVLQHEEYRYASIAKICRRAGYKDPCPWQRAIKNERFVAELESLGVPIRKHHLPPHLAVEPAIDIDEELTKDVWDIRRFKHDYPKHVSPATYEVNFSKIDNPVLQEQVKRYFRLRLTQWEAGTFQRALYHLNSVLALLPSDIHVGTLQRHHIEALLPAMSQLSPIQLSKGLRTAKTMFEYMTTSPAWAGPRPPRFLIWEEDIPPRPEALPRPIPPDVLDQFDPLLEQAEKAIKEGQEPSILAPVFWDALLILRHTGMRFEDLAHLKAPDERGKKANPSRKQQLPNVREFLSCSCGAILIWYRPSKKQNRGDYTRQQHHLLIGQRIRSLPLYVGDLKR